MALARTQSLEKLAERHLVSEGRSGFNRQNEANTNGTMNQQRGNVNQTPSPTGYSQAMPPTQQAASMSSNNGPNTDNAPNGSEKQVKSDSKFFFQPKYAKLGVKGNFMPLAAKPANVDLADWLAHQTVENYRLVSTIAQCIQEVDTNTGKPVCNPESCPTMTAGLHTYTWLDNNKAPVSVSAAQYIGLVQRWMNGKIHDPKAFPTEPTTTSSAIYASGSVTTPSSEKPIAAGPTTSNAPLSKLAGREWVGKSAGFPETFLHDVRTCFRQIFRIYAHLYHSHWVDPFWHISGSSSGGYTDLNSCFVHFCTVAKLYGLLSDKDAVPMQPLIEIWIANGSIPPDAATSACAIAPQ